MSLSDDPINSTPPLPGATPSRQRLCIAATAASSLYYLYRDQFRFLHEAGFDVTGVCAPGPELKFLRDEPIEVVPLRIERRPSPLRDLATLVKAYRFFRARRFDLVHVSTPKAALLIGLAARLAGHRRLVLTMHGRPYENATGLKRRIMASLDTFACRLARRVNPVSMELCRLMSQEGQCDASKMRVLANGSNNGVDIVHFNRTPAVQAKGSALRESLGIETNDVVVLSLGWIRKEKGIGELVTAFTALAEKYPRLHLLLVGWRYDADEIDGAALETIDRHPRIHHLPWQEDPTSAYAAADILAFPTYREGFGNVAIEAAAMKLPVVASDIVGCRESVQHEMTGLLVPPRSASALQAALDRLIGDPALRSQFGSAGRDRVVRSFPRELVWTALVTQYRELLQEPG